MQLSRSCTGGGGHLLSISARCVPCHRRYASSKPATFRSRQRDLCFGRCVGGAVSRDRPCLSTNVRSRFKTPRLCERSVANALCVSRRCASPNQEPYSR
ncbi:hypothetical protein FOM02_19490 [Bradyrhizobium sp. SEMIA]|nr:hypothetical protein FOM02_19490 [Bradyrhizobium sp. SEMIA]